MMCSINRPQWCSFGSSTASLDIGPFSGRAAWPGNASVSLNQSLHGADFRANLSAEAQSISRQPIRQKNWPALLILIIIFITIGGNILVILAVSLERKLQNATNFFLRSLAVADMLVGILVMPISLINVLYDYAWPLPHALCPIWIYLDVLFSTASIMHLCAISLDRYLAIRNPIEHSRFNSLTRAKLKIAAVWTISIGISMPVPVIGLHNEAKVFVNGSCALNEKKFMLAGSFVAFFIPLVIMVVTYCLTVQALQRQASVFQYKDSSARCQQPPQPAPPSQALPRHSSPAHPQGDPSNSSPPGNSTSSISPQLSSPMGRDLSGHRRRGMMQAIKNERRASKVLGVVFFLFLLMWCPFFITNVTYVLCSGLCSEPLLGELLNVFVWVGYVSSGVNPLVYTLFNNTYRSAFSSYLRCWYQGGGSKKRLHAAVACPSLVVMPTLLCEKEGIDLNRNCQNSERNPPLREKELEDGQMHRAISEVSVNSQHTLTEHTSSV